VIILSRIHCWNARLAQHVKINVVDHSHITPGTLRDAEKAPDKSTQQPGEDGHHFSTTKAISETHGLTSDSTEKEG
jgi:hypothetical protein